MTQKMQTNANNQKVYKYDQTPINKTKTKAKRVHYHKRIKRAYQTQNCAANSNFGCRSPQARLAALTH